MHNSSNLLTRQALWVILLQFQVNYENKERLVETETLNRFLISTPITHLTSVWEMYFSFGTN